MKLTDSQLKDLMADKEVELRVLKKEGEYIAHELIDFKYEFEKLKPSGWLVAKKGYPKIKYKKIEPTTVCSVSERIKFQVGNSYAVRKPKGLWYCPKCNGIVYRKEYNPLETIDGIYMQGDCNYFICNCEGIAITNQFLFNMKNPTKYIHGEFKIIGWKPLRYKLTAIRSEKLLDITRSGIKKSGFKNKKEFMEFFNKNNSKKRAEAFYENIGGKTWNPEVWVLTIKKEETV